MSERIVEFLSFEGCPFAPKALAALTKAINSLSAKLDYNVRHVDLLDPATPELLRRWGSPTILLDGQDITGAKPGAANCCRVYNAPGGVPSAQEIAEALQEIDRKSQRKKHRQEK